MLTCLPVDETSWKIGSYGVLRSILPLPTLMKKIGELARFQYRNALLFNHFRNIVPTNLFEKWSYGHSGSIA